MRWLIKFLLILAVLMVIPFYNVAYGSDEIEIITFQTEEEFFEHVVVEAIRHITPSTEFTVDIMNLYQTDKFHFAVSSPFYSFFVDTPVNNIAAPVAAGIQFTVKF